MTASSAPKISKWPFFLGDALLLALAWFVSTRSATPNGVIELCVYVACVAIGAWISITPYLKEYQAELKFAESNQLITVASQLKNLEQLAGQIGYATSQWQTIRESADKTSAAARSIAEGMAAEVQAFNEFIKKTNDSEKATLRLEIDKLRRGEVEWLQVVVRILDHVFAVHQAALRSQQPGIAEQLGRFQAACLDSARRIGLGAFAAAQGEAFDQNRHQLMEGPDAKAPEGATVELTLAPGYTFQGRLIRPAMVKLQSAATESEETPAASSATPELEDQSTIAASEPAEVESAMSESAEVETAEAEPATTEPVEDQPPVSSSSEESSEPAPKPDAPQQSELL